MAYLNLFDHLSNEDAGGKWYDVNNELGNGAMSEVINPTNLNVTELGDATPVFRYCVPASTDPNAPNPNAPDCESCTDVGINLCTCDAEILWVSIEDYVMVGDYYPFNMKFRAKCSIWNPDWNAANVPDWTIQVSTFEGAPIGSTNNGVDDNNNQTPTNATISSDLQNATGQNCNTWTEVFVSGRVVDAPGQSVDNDWLSLGCAVGRGGFQEPSNPDGIVDRCGPIGLGYVVDITNLGYTTNIPVITALNGDSNCTALTAKLEAYFVPATEVGVDRWRLIVVPSCIANNDIEFRFDPSNTVLATKPFNDYNLEDLDANGTIDSGFSNTWFFEIRSKSNNTVTTGVFQVTF